MAQPVIRNITLNIATTRAACRRNIMEAVSTASLIGHGLAMPIGAVAVQDAMFEMIDALMAGAPMAGAGPTISEPAAPADAEA